MINILDKIKNYSLDVVFTDVNNLTSKTYECAVKILNSVTTCAARNKKAFSLGLVFLFIIINKKVFKFDSVFELMIIKTKKALSLFNKSKSTDKSTNLKSSSDSESKDELVGADSEVDKLSDEVETQKSSKSKDDLVSTAAHKLVTNVVSKGLSEAALVSTAAHKLVTNVVSKGLSEAALVSTAAHKLVTNAVSKGLSEAALVSAVANKAVDKLSDEVETQELSKSNQVKSEKVYALKIKCINVIDAINDENIKIQFKDVLSKNNKFETVKDLLKFFCKQQQLELNKRNKVVVR